MTQLTKSTAGAALNVCLTLACAPNAERPPYVDQDNDGPSVPRPSPAPGPSGETGSGGDDASDGTGAPSHAAASTEPQDTGEVPLPPGFGPLAEWAQSASWSGLQRMIAASPAGEVYVTDGKNVYAAKEGEPKPFLNVATLGYEENYALLGIAVDGMGNVHVFIQSTGGAAVDHVFDAAGNASEVRTVSEAEIHYPTVSPEGDVFYIDSDGVKAASTSGSGFMLATAADFGGTVSTGCESEAFVVGPERFYYLPGCEDSPIYSGVRDGSYNRVLVEIHEVQSGVDHVVGMNHDYGFEGIAAHPLGGVVLNFEQVLLRIHDNGSWELYNTEPWPGFLRNEGSPFHAAPIALDESSAYLLAEDRIWKAGGILEQ